MNAHTINKVVLAAAVALFIGGTLAATPAQAETLQDPTMVIPSNMVGVSEADFASFKKQFPCGAQPLQACVSTTPSLMMRVEASGQMYQTYGYMDGAVYTVALKRYLPDGLYKQKDKVYLVKNGRRIKLKKGKAYKRTVRAAQSGAATTLPVDMYHLMIDKSTACTVDFAEMDAEECSDWADEKRTAWSGNLIMNSETGELAYIPAGGKNSALVVEKKMDDGTNWYKTVKSMAIKQPNHLIKKLPSGFKLGTFDDVHFYGQN